MGTIVKRRCANCGHTCTKYIYGYVGDTIGVPFVRCTQCNKISRDTTHKEWIQMKGYEKIFAISPRGIAYACMGGVLSSLIIFGFANSFFSSDNEIVSKVCFYLVLLSIPVIYCFILCRAVNGASFIDRYTRSIRRTNNEMYKALLEKMGHIYSKELPLNLKFNNNSRRVIEESLEKWNKVDDIIIPTIEQSITNI